MKRILLILLLISICHADDFFGIGISHDDNFVKPVQMVLSLDCMKFFTSSSISLGIKAKTDFDDIGFNIPLSYYYSILCASVSLDIVSRVIIPEKMFVFEEYIVSYPCGIGIMYGDNLLFKLMFYYDFRYENYNEEFLFIKDK